MKELRSINKKMGSLSAGPDFDLCLAQHLAESISELNLAFVDVFCGVSLLERNDAILTKWVMRIMESLFDLSLRLK